MTDVEEDFEAHTSESMENVAKEHGWTTEVIPNMDEFQLTGKISDILWTLYGKRGKETLKVEWRGDTQISATHKSDRGKITHPAWRGGVMKLIEAKPKLYNVPFNIQDDAAYDIMLALYRKRITFLRTIDGQEDEIYVDVNLKEKASAKMYKLKETSTGRRVLEWADSHGFHAVGLDQIIDVS